jgi:hypothetical protein
MAISSVNESTEQPAPLAQRQVQTASTRKRHWWALAIAAIAIAVVLVIAGLSFVEKWSRVKVVIVNPLWEDYSVAVRLDGEWTVDGVSVPANETMTFGPWSVTAGSHHCYCVCWNESLVPKYKLYDSYGHKFCLLPLESKTFTMTTSPYTLE